MQQCIRLHNKYNTRNTIVVWKYWCRAIGTKAFDENDKADAVAIIRTVWIVLHIITCFAIILNAWRHW